MSRLSPSCRRSPRRRRSNAHRILLPARAGCRSFTRGFAFDGRALVAAARFWIAADGLGAADWVLAHGFRLTVSRTWTAWLADADRLGPALEDVRQTAQTFLSHLRDTRNVRDDHFLAGIGSRNAERSMLRLAVQRQPTIAVAKIACCNSIALEALVTHSQIHRPLVLAASTFRRFSARRMSKCEAFADWRDGVRRVDFTDFSGDSD